MRSALPLILRNLLAEMVGTTRWKISEGGVGRVPETVTRENAINLECVVSQIGDDYYWASRENKPMVRIEATAYTTFVAVDGAGYVKVVKPDRKATAALVDEAAERFDYVEHLTLGLRSVALLRGSDEQVGSLTAVRGAE
jgi:hypothetical protein